MDHLHRSGSDAFLLSLLEVQVQNTLFSWPQYKLARVVTPFEFEALLQVELLCFVAGYGSSHGEWECLHRAISRVGILILHQVGVLEQGLILGGVSGSLLSVEGRSDLAVLEVFDSECVLGHGLECTLLRPKRCFLGHLIKNLRLCFG